LALNFGRDKDCSNIADTEKPMGGNKAILYLVDSPYNVVLQGSNGLTIQNDGPMPTSANPSENAFKCASAMLKPGAVFYAF